MYPQQPQMPQAPAPQYPQQPQYPAAAPQYPQAPAQQYAPPPAPAQQYYAPQYQAPAAPPQPTAPGSLDSFFNQPSAGGGKALTFETIGTTYVGIVARAITNGDIQQQTNRQGVPQFFKDGRPKFVMKVPLQMQPNPAYPDGLAQWYIKGQARDELVRAMAEAGAPEGPPEAGAIVQIQYTGDRQIPGLNPAKQVRVVYQRPNGGQPVAQPASAPPAPAPVQQAAPVPVAQPNFVPPVPQPVAQMPATPMPPQAPVPATAPGQPQLSQEQQDLLARLTGQQPAA